LRQLQKRPGRNPGTFRVVVISILMLMTLGLLISCAQSTPIKAPSVTTTPLPPLKIEAYRLQPGDSISVVFWGQSEFDQELSIRPDGRISLPFVDEVQAGGLTPKELDDELTRLYTGELASPEITIIVREVPSQRIYVGGEVEEQGAYPIVGHLTITQAVQEAGGFLTTARRSEVLLIRTESTGERFARQVDLRPVISGRDLSLDISLQPFDIVFVPRSKITNIGLFVEQYINNIIPDFVRIQLTVFDQALLTSSDD